MSSGLINTFANQNPDNQTNFFLHQVLDLITSIYTRNYLFPIDNTDQLFHYPDGLALDFEMDTSRHLQDLQQL